MTRYQINFTDGTTEIVEADSVQREGGEGGGGLSLTGFGGLRDPASYRFSRRVGQHGWEVVLIVRCDRVDLVRLLTPTPTPSSVGSAP